MASKNGQPSRHTKAYLMVWVALLCLTAITVKVSYHDYGTWNIAVAMLVATIKGTLVALFFMHLKYDKKVNQVIFISGFLFLAIFVALAGSDEFDRSQGLSFARVHEVKAPEGAASGQIKQFLKSSPELIAKGKELFQQNCVLCHGPEGRGDGPASTSLNPKPRNFTSNEGWKNGRAPSQIFKTLTEGLPPSAMASFATLSVQDRLELAHYVDTLGPPPVPQDTPQSLAAIGVTEGGGPEKAAQPSAILPISFAMERILQEAGKK
jgi:caa(3)-type oxidase subunit IV